MRTSRTIFLLLSLTLCAPLTHALNKNETGEQAPSGRSKAVSGCVASENRLLATFINKQLLEENAGFAGPGVPNFGSAYGVLDVCLMRKVFDDLVKATSTCNPSKAANYQRFVDKADEWSTSYERMSCPELVAVADQRYKGFFIDKLSVDNEDARQIMRTSALQNAEREARIRGNRPQPVTPPSSPPAKSDNSCGDGRPRTRGGVCAVR